MTQVSEEKPTTKEQTWADRWIGLDCEFMLAPGFEFDARDNDGNRAVVDVVKWNEDLMSMRDRAAAFTISFLMGDRRSPRVIVLSGRSGCGKSHVARAVVRAARSIGINLWRDGKRARMPVIRTFQWSVLANFEHDHKRFEPMWEDAVTADMLMLDDVGSETDRYRTGLPADNLRMILEERRNRHTIITTNIHPKNWKNQWDDRVKERFHRDSTIVCMEHAWSYSQATHNR